MKAFKTLAHAKPGKLPNPPPPVVNQSRGDKRGEQLLFATPEDGLGETLGIIHKGELSCIRASLEMVGEAPKFCLCRWDYSDHGWFPVCYTSMKFHYDESTDLKRFLAAFDLKA